MLQSIAINFIYLALLLPIILLVVNRNIANWKKSIGLFCLYFLLYKIALLIPINIEWMQIDGLNWNWLGKILAITLSLTFYHLFKQNLGQELFVNAKPQKEFIKSSIILLVVVSVISIMEGILFYNQKWDTETLLFQLTVPGIDEEIAYRGIIVGLFSSFMSKQISFKKIVIHHPSIWIAGILFGLIHALQFDKQWNLAFDLFYFIKTFLLGLIWGYMTIKTKSILLSIISHNLSNTLANFIGMIK